jgi:hypothetical protein
MRAEELHLPRGTSFTLRGQIAVDMNSPHGCVVAFLNQYLNRYLTGKTSTGVCTKKSVKEQFAALPHDEKMAWRGSPMDALFVAVPNADITDQTLFFNREVESIEKALKDFGYLYDRLWLPWADGPEALGREEANHQSEVGSVGRVKQKRNHDPGVILFTPGTVPKQSALPQRDLAVFLISETPTSGINPEAFGNAIQLQNTLSSRNNEVLLLGPYFSDSLHSLKKIITAARPKDVPSFRIVSGTATSKQARDAFSKELSGHDTFETAVPYSDCDAATQALAYLKKMGRTTETAVFLTDSGITFGKKSCIPIDDYRQNIVQFGFPRGISGLRHALANYRYGISHKDSQESMLQHFLLPSSLTAPKSSSNEIPPISQEQTPISVQAVLANIAGSIRREKAKFAVVAAADILDEIYIAQFIREHSPSLRIIVLDADLLFVNAAQETPALIGTLSVTTYPLINLNQHWTSGNYYDDSQTRLVFPSRDAEGIYNACIRLLQEGDQKGTAPPDGTPFPDRGGSSNLRARYEVCDTCHGVERRDYRPPIGSGNFPPLWLTVIGRNAYWPIALIDPNQMSTTDTKVDSQNNSEEFQDIEPPARGWTLCFWLLSVGGFLFFMATFLPLVRRSGPHVLFILKRAAWLTAVFRFIRSWPHWPHALFTLKRAAWLTAVRFIRSWPQVSVLPNLPGRLGRASCLLAFGLTLTAGYAMFVFPLWLSKKIPGLPGAQMIHTEESPRWLAWVIVFMCLTSGVFPYIGMLNAALLKNLRTALTALLRHRPLLSALAAAAMFGGFSYFGYQAVLGSKLRSQEWFFLLRSTRLDTGVSPVLPLLIIAAGILCAAWIHYQRLLNAALRRPKLPAVPRLSTKGAAAFNKRCKAFFAGWKDLVSTSAVLIGAIFVVKIWQHPESLETLPYNWLWASSLVFLAILVVSAFARFTSCWNALRDLLIELDNHPLRLAFSRMPKEYSWFPIWQWGGTRRSYKLLNRLNELTFALADSNILHENDVLTFRAALEHTMEAKKDLAECARYWESLNRAACSLTQSVAKELECYWKKGFFDTLWKLRHDKPAEEATEGEKQELRTNKSIILKEEFVAMPFVAFIGYSLVQLRNLLTFLVLGFAFMVISLNFYPFLSQWILKGAMVVVFLVLAFGITFVFVQMDRDALLNRLTNKTVGLGWDFCRRVVAFGTIPFFTVLGTYVPAVGASLSSFLEPVLRVLRSD